MSVLLTILGIGTVLYLILYYTVIKGAICTSSVSLKGKTAIVTGSNTGIGKTTALDLAKRGSRVILACRNRERAEAAVYDIRKVRINNRSYFHTEQVRLRATI